MVRTDLPSLAFCRCLVAHRRLRRFGRKGSAPQKGGGPCQSLDRSLAIGRASYQRWLGTEPEEIAAAAEVLRRFAPEHPCLLELEVRLCRARQIKAMLSRNSSSRSAWRRTTRSGGGFDGETRRSLRRGNPAQSLLRPRASYPFCPSPSDPTRAPWPTRTGLGVVRRDHRIIKRE